MTDETVPDTLEAAHATAVYREGPLAIIGIDCEGTITTWNPGAQRFLGHAAEAMLGMPIDTVATRPTAGAIRKLLLKVTRGRNVPPAEGTLLHADGHLVEVAFSFHATHDAAGHVCGACLVGTDITERKRKEQLLARQAGRVQTIVETALDGIFSFNPAGIIDAINPAAERIFGYHAHEIIGKTYHLLIPDVDIIALVAGGDLTRQHTEVSAQHARGDRFPAELAVAEAPQERGASFVCVIRDISERKRTQAELHALNLELTHNVDQLSTALAHLREAQKQLVEAEKMASLGALVAGVAHEINTPVGVSIAAVTHWREEVQQFRAKVESGALKRSELETFVDDSQSAVQITEKNLRRAANLVKSFKQVAADRSNDSVREFALHTFLEELLVTLEPEAREIRRDIRLACPGDLVINTYPGVFSQVITNLYVNALRHGLRERGHGTITIDARADGTDWFVLEFADDGKGIPPDELARIFDPFYTTARNNGGTGLGLHLVYNQVSQILHGSISAQSKPGEGTHFTLRLPRDIDQVNASGRHSGPPASPPARELHG